MIIVSTQVTPKVPGDAAPLLMQRQNVNTAVAREGYHPLGVFTVTLKKPLGLTLAG
jgi:hypothetical protein